MKSDKSIHIDPEVFRAYDIRGIVPKQINAEDAEQIARAFCSEIDKRTVIVGRDVRLSGKEFLKSIINGIIRSGVDVINIGQVSTDEFYFACGTKELPGIMITASHNPPEYNGFKMVTSFPQFIMAKEFMSKVIDTNYKDSKKVGSVAEESISEDFVNHILKIVDAKSIKPLKVVVDTSNGSQGAVWNILQKKLPIKVVPLYWEPDGRFPNHGNDIIQLENQESLRQEVKEKNADLGLIFDPDGDRCLLVDNRGESVPGDFITALMSVSVLKSNPGATILYDIRASDAVPDLIRGAGGKPFIWKPGHVYIKAKMKEIGAVFGGEVSGHFYFKDFWYADCGILAGLNLLSYVSSLDVPLSTMLEELEAKYFISGEINSKVSDVTGLLDNLRKKYSDGESETLDGNFSGLSIRYPDWHFVVRPSDNEPLVRLTLEANSNDLMLTKKKELLKLIRR